MYEGVVVESGKHDELLRRGSLDVRSWGEKLTASELREAAPVPVGAI
jgi:hypothetical protein